MLKFLYPRLRPNAPKVMEVALRPPRCYVSLVQSHVISTRPERARAASEPFCTEHHRWAAPGLRPQLGPNRKKCDTVALLAAARQDRRRPATLCCGPFPFPELERVLTAVFHAPIAALPRGLYLIVRTDLPAPDLSVRSRPFSGS